MSFNTNLQRTLVMIVFVGFGFASAVFAEEATTTPPSAPQTVTFTVTVGELKCTDGKGVASVNFANDPEAGGYYEVFGEPITKNEIALGRSVELPTGEYSWKGDTNEGYTAVGAVSGSFSVGGCPKTSVKETDPIQSQTLRGPEEKTLVSEEPLIKPEAPENKDIPNIGGTATTTEPIIVPKTSSTNNTKTAEILIFVLAALGIGIAFIVKKPTRPK